MGALDDTVPTLFSNRAACFLKLGRYAQAREDAEKAIELKPDLTKGHFRLALALQAEEKFAEACASFDKVLKLEPKNKDAASGLRMAEVQAERQRLFSVDELKFVELHVIFLFLDESIF